MEELWPVLPKFFQKTEKERTGANSFYEALPHFFPTEPNKGKERNLQTSISHKNRHKNQWNRIEGQKPEGKEKKSWKWTDRNDAVIYGK